MEIIISIALMIITIAIIVLILTLIAVKLGDLWKVCENKSDDYVSPIISNYKNLTCGELRTVNTTI